MCLEEDLELKFFYLWRKVRKLININQILSRLGIFLLEFSNSNYASDSKIRKFITFESKFQNRAKQGKGLKIK